MGPRLAVPAGCGVCRRGKVYDVRHPHVSRLRESHLMSKELPRLSAVELARLVRTKKASPVQVVEAHLAAIQRINPAVNAFCTVAAEKALAWARDAERAVKKRAKLKALHGVPVAIK